MEMPSVNWREVADNWFGACCCSFGGISEKLVMQYIKTYDCVEGTCLLDSASVIICKDDLEGYTFQQHWDEQSDKNSKIDTEPNDNQTDTMKEGCKNMSDNTPFICTTSSVDNNVERNVLGSDSFKCEKHINPLACQLTSSADCTGLVTDHDSLFMESSRLAQLSLNEIQSTVFPDSSSLNNDSENLEKLIQLSADELSPIDHCHCCLDEAQYVADANSQKLAENTGPVKIQKWLHDCSLGSGFMNRIANLSDNVEWVTFSCRSCSSVLGAYPSNKNRNEPVDGGVRLFKCYVSTSIPVCGPHDIFR